MFLGDYPILKPELDKMKAPVFWKLLLFNAAIGVMYFLLIRLFGMEQIASEYAELGTALTVILLIIGNVTFFLLDIVLGRLNLNKKQGRR